MVALTGHSASNQPVTVTGKHSLLYSYRCFALLLLLLLVQVKHVRIVMLSAMYIFVPFLTYNKCIEITIIRTFQ